MARDEYETWIFFSFLRAACVCFCVCVSCFCCCCVSDDRIDGIDQNRRPVRIDWWIERSDPFDRQSRNGQKNERGTTRKKSSTFLPKVPNEWHYPSDFIEFFPKIRGNFFEKIWKNKKIFESVRWRYRRVDTSAGMRSLPLDPFRKEDRNSSPRDISSTNFLFLFHPKNINSNARNNHNNNKKKFEYLYANGARYGTAFLLRFHIWPALKIYFNC